MIILKEYVSLFENLLNRTTTISDCSVNNISRINDHFCSKLIIANLNAILMQYLCTIHFITRILAVPSSFPTVFCIVRVNSGNMSQKEKNNGSFSENHIIYCPGYHNS